MPNSAEDDALTQTLIAQLMAEDLGETLCQHRRPIGSSAEDYEFPVFRRGELKNTVGENGTGWEDEPAEAPVAPIVEATPNERATQPAVEYPGGWDSSIAYSDGLQLAAPGSQEDKGKESNQPTRPVAFITDTCHTSDSLPAYTILDPLFSSKANPPVDNGPENIWSDTSFLPTAEEPAAANQPPPTASSRPVSGEPEQTVFNVWGPEDMDMDIDTSSKKNKGKARAISANDDEDNLDECMDDAKFEGNRDEDSSDQPSTTAKGKRRRLETNWDSSDAFDSSKAATRTLSTRPPLPRPSHSPFSFFDTCSCPSCEKYPGFKDEEGNEIPLIHIPWPESDRDEIMERAEDNEVVEIHVGEEETLDSILEEMILRDEMRERVERESRGMVAF
ncbi:hypothetical protein P7C71_g5062, partial [Lecanoromycetidae sp. Uapishka_2]